MDHSLNSCRIPLSMDQLENLHVFALKSTKKLNTRNADIGYLCSFFNLYLWIFDFRAFYMLKECTKVVCTAFFARSSLYIN